MPFPKAAGEILAAKSVQCARTYVQLGPVSVVVFCLKFI